MDIFPKFGVAICSVGTKYKGILHFSHCVALCCGIK